MQYREASFSFSKDLITVSTGVVERKWEWTGEGFVTTGYRHLLSGREWALLVPEHSCDWDLPSKTGNGTSATLLSVDCEQSDDRGFTSGHLLITTSMQYDSGIEL